jgi:UDP-N-acetyl-D-glucosamine dehydrogenase
MSPPAVAKMVRSDPSEIQCTSERARALYALVAARKAKIGIIGMGYVGQPLSVAANKAGFDVTGFDIDPSKVEKLNRNEAILRAPHAEALKKSAFTSELLTACRASCSFPR